MSERIKYFLSIDDDYLVGLSNKGIVKRSYKDLEDTQLNIVENDDYIEMSDGEVNCRLVMPLGDSKCSCPSRSMCKHIVMGAIAVKRKYETEGAGKQGETLPVTVLATGQDGRLTDDMATVMQNPSTTSDVVSVGSDRQSTDNQITSTENIDSITGTVIANRKSAFPELESYTLDQIKKQLGASAFRKVCQRMKVAEAPNITITSVVTVTFIDTGTIVKLLEPVTYSTCSCHKKELCSHKAEAIIAYQLHKGILTKDMLDSYYEGTDNPEFDIDEIKELIVSMKQLLGEIIFTGLARISPDMTDSCERMAIMCHNGRLANFESDFRRLSERLNKYFKRHATSDTTALMHFVCEVYGRTIKLDKAINGSLDATSDLKLSGKASSNTDRMQDGRTDNYTDKVPIGASAKVINTDALQQIAGKLRSEYELSKPLSLMGMGLRHFVSQAGFEGETVYFIEEETGQWYTYTNARPTIYDNRGVRGLNANSPAPWGLNCSLDTLSEHRIRLTNGKVSVENRLSSTSEAVAELIGNRDLNHETIKSHIYSDFGKLFAELFGDHWFEDETQDREISHLAIVRPSAVEEADFDSIKQAFYMRLADEQGQQLSIKLTYSKEDKYIINHLERLHRRIKEGRRGVPDFFGRLYIEDDELRMYPIEYYDREDDKEEVS